MSKKKNAPTTVKKTVTAPKVSLCKTCKKSCKTNLMSVSHCGNYQAK